MRFEGVGVVKSLISSLVRDLLAEVVSLQTDIRTEAVAVGSRTYRAPLPPSPSPHLRVKVQKKSHLGEPPPSTYGLAASPPTGLLPR